jgi:hypothetical protein
MNRRAFFKALIAAPVAVKAVVAAEPIPQGSFIEFDYSDIDVGVQSYLDLRTLPGLRDGTMTVTGRWVYDEPWAKLERVAAIPEGPNSSPHPLDSLGSAAWRI